jgi:hypothetical protein
MIMHVNEIAANPTPNAPEAKGEQRQPNRGGYQAPRLVVIGTAVELVQGYRGRRYDGANGATLP